MTESSDANETLRYNPAQQAFLDGDIAFTFEVQGSYDGMSIAIRQSDGAWLNRWADPLDPTQPAPGRRRLFDAIQAVIDNHNKENNVQPEA